MATVNKVPSEDNLGEYVRALGKIMGNLHSLEYMLRVFHHHEAGEVPEVKLDSVRVGDVVAENAMTNYWQMRKLIKRYNEIVSTRLPSLVLPEDEIVSLRDAIAHGRVYGMQAAPPLRLLKFSEAKSGKVTVTVAETMAPGWLEQKRSLLHDAINSVARALPPG